MKIISNRNRKRATKSAILGALFLIFSFTIHAQSDWKEENYNTVFVENFRDYAPFKNIIDTSKINYALLNACLFYTVNEQRKKLGLSILPRHSALEAAAFFHSKKMAELSFYNHSNPIEPARESTTQRGKLAGITNAAIAECIYIRNFEKGQTYLSLSEAFTKGWMESKGHYDIITSKSNKAFGAGIYFKGNNYFGFRGTLAFQWFSDVKYDATSAVDRLPY